MSICRSVSRVPSQDARTPVHSKAASGPTSKLFTRRFDASSVPSRDAASELQHPTLYKLHRHTRAKHERRQVACSHDGCAFRTSWPEYLKRHVESVHKNMLRYCCHVCRKGYYLNSNLRRHQQVHARQGHPVAECISYQEDLMKGYKQSSLATQEQQPSFSSDGVSDLLTSVHLDMRLLSSSNK